MEKEDLAWIQITAAISFELWLNPSLVLCCQLGALGGCSICMWILLECVSSPALPRCLCIWKVQLQRSSAGQVPRAALSPLRAWPMLRAWSGGLSPVFFQALLKKRWEMLCLLCASEKKLPQSQSGPLSLKRAMESFLLPLDSCGPGKPEVRTPG